MVADIEKRQIIFKTLAPAAARYFTLTTSPAFGLLGETQ